MNRIALAFRSFFALLLHGRLSSELVTDLGLAPRPSAAPKPAAPAAPAVKTTDGALQMLAILQRDARLIDFLMEDISAYEDDQVGAAVRSLHDQCRQSLERYLRLSPVIDAVEGSFARPALKDPAAIKFLGNVPAQGQPEGGTLRHKGWKAEKVELPPVNPKQDVRIIAPAEIEIE